MLFVSTIIGILYDQIVSKFRNFPVSIQIGNYTYGNPKIVSFSETNKLLIGKFCSIADNVTIVLSEHSLNMVSTYPLKGRLIEKKEVDQVSKGPVIIENDVQIGTGAIILSNVKISNGAVVGAGSVVTKDVPPYAIVAGTPAKVLRYRFTPEQINKLLKIKWWDWEIQKIRENIDLFYGDIEFFLNKFS